MSARLLSRMTDTPVFAQFVAALDRLDRERSGLLRVLTYHRVDKPEARPYLSPVLRSASPETFDAQMRMVASRYHPISIPHLLEFYSSGTPLPARAVLVTFDDAYCDFEEHAWPVLKRYGIPATVFVPTGFPDHPERQLWWDQLFYALTRTARAGIDTPAGYFALASDTERTVAFKRLRTYVKTLPHERAMAWVDEVCQALDAPPLERNSILGWDALRKLAQEGVTLGAHTRTHPLVNRVSLAEAREEAVNSLRDLEREIGQVPPIFAYPSGGFTEEIAQGLAAEGFKLGFTTVRGLNVLSKAHPLLLRRINVGGRTSLALLRAQMLPSMHYLNRFLH